MVDTADQAPDAHERIVRVLVLCFGLAGLLFIGISYPTVPDQWRIAAQWWSVLALELVLAPYAVLAAGAYLLSVAALRRWAATLVAGYVPVMLLVVPAFPRGVFDDATSMVWVNTMPALVICASALLLRGPAVVALAVCVGAASSVTWWWTLAEPTAAWVVRLPLSATVQGLFFAVVTAAVLRGAAALDTETRRVRDGVALRVGNEAQAAERGRLDALVHDRVLSALLAGGRGTERGTACRSAAAALRALDEIAAPDTDAGDIGAPELVARVRQVCADAAEDAAFSAHVDGMAVRVAQPVARVLQEVAGEALRNSARHAGAPGHPVRRWVQVRVSGGEVTLVVADDGVGFSPAKVPAERLGIAVGIRARVAEVPGGSVTITTAPGAGTVVRATVPAGAHVELHQARPPAPRSAPEFTTTTAPALVGLHTRGVAALVLILALLQAAAAANEEAPGVTGPHYWPALLCLLAALWLVLRPGPEPMPTRQAAGAVALVVAAAALNTAAAHGHHYYGLGAMWAWGPAVLGCSLMALRGRAALGAVGGACLAAVYLAWAALPGSGADKGFVVAMALSALVLHVVMVLFAWRARVFVARLNTVRSHAVTLAAQNAAEQARTRERDGQLRYLQAAAQPLLVSLRDTGALGEAERRRALLLEARLRDRIRARALATPEVLDAAEAARAAGAEVALLDDGALEPSDPLAGRIAAIAAQELRHCADDKVTVRLLPPGRGVLCTIVRTGQDSYERIELVPAEPPDLVACRVAG